MDNQETGTSTSALLVTAMQSHFKAKRDQAVAHLSVFVNHEMRSYYTPEQIRSILQTDPAAMKEPGFTLEGAQGPSIDKQVFPGSKTMIEVRQQARAAGQWAIADAIRERLGALGIALEDRADGTSWRKK